MKSSSNRAKGEKAWSSVKHVNAELFTLTYGAIVVQLMKDYEDVNAVNLQLEQMGYNIGMRLADEFMAVADVGRCSSFAQSAEVIAEVGFKMFLGCTAKVSIISDTQFDLILDDLDNPLTEYVEVPQSAEGLVYCNVLCGVIRGAMEMVQLEVTCAFHKDALKGHPHHVIRVTFVRKLSDEIPVGEDD